MPLQSVRMMWFSSAPAARAAGALTDADWTLYESSVTRTCDQLDGVEDGILENPMRCRFEVATLACKPGQATGCLPAAKVAMLGQIVSPMPDERGTSDGSRLQPGRAHPAGATVSVAAGDVGRRSLR
jgi:feruloyl esterase